MQEVDELGGQDDWHHDHGGDADGQDDDLDCKVFSLEPHATSGKLFRPLIKQSEKLNLYLGEEVARQLSGD